MKANAANTVPTAAATSPTVKCESTPPLLPGTGATVALPGVGEGEGAAGDGAVVVTGAAVLEGVAVVEGPDVVAGAVAVAAPVGLVHAVAIANYEYAHTMLGYRLSVPPLIWLYELLFTSHCDC